ncbi:MAG TPA: dihydropteroate synthase [Gaiellales bacterium]|nr:dihydropteroate synthase [Gaiellales bacterium]
MHLRFAQRSLARAGPPLVMGVVNVTPDSFYDRGATSATDDAVRHGLALVVAGADLLDVGGMTAQPGEPVSEAVEIDRVVPVVAALRERAALPIAVDTYRAAVADAALSAGADLVNDHTGLSDPALAGVVAGHDAGIVLTHLELQPKQPQDGRYAVPVEEIASRLTALAGAARAAGVREDAILLDPGLGFGKDTATDLATLRHLPELRALGYPLLLAPSHKEVTAEPLGLPESALEGTAAVVAVAAYLGVDVLRLHDLPFMGNVASMGWMIAAADQAGTESSPSKNEGRNRPSR